MKIIRSKNFSPSRAWDSLDIANMNGITTRLHCKRSNNAQTPPICPEVLLTDFSQSALSNSGESAHRLVWQGAG